MKYFFTAFFALCIFAAQNVFGNSDILNDNFRYPPLQKIMSDQEIVRMSEHFQGNEMEFYPRILDIMKAIQHSKLLLGNGSGKRYFLSCSSVQGNLIIGYNVTSCLALEFHENKKSVSMMPIEFRGLIVGAGGGFLLNMMRFLIEFSDVSRLQDMAQPMRFLNSSIGVFTGQNKMWQFKISGQDIISGKTKYSLYFSPALGDVTAENVKTGTELNKTFPWYLNLNLLNYTILNPSERPLNSTLWPYTFNIK